MGLFRQRVAGDEPDQTFPDSSSDSQNISKDGDIQKGSPIHKQTRRTKASKWKTSRSGDGDTAMALFGDPDEVSEAVDPAEEKKLVRKIDYMILPYLAVCYAFFYIDKTTLPYAAIFGIQEDLNLVGTQYSWLSSSILYFAFLVWAFPTTFMMHRFPVGEYLDINIFIWGIFLMLQAVAKTFAVLASSPTQTKWWRDSYFYYLTGPYNAAFVLILSLQTANTAGHTKQVVTNAMLFLGYCAGNIAGPFFYKTDQSPTYNYKLGIWSMLVSHLIEVAVILTLELLLSRANKKRDRAQQSMSEVERELDRSRTAFSDMTDRENLSF
ncbi:MAG: hypothetical protein M1837_007305, partial [Sclerophora amabilis]